MYCICRWCHSDGSNGQINRWLLWSAKRKPLMWWMKVMSKITLVLMPLIWILLQDEPTKIYWTNHWWPELQAANQAQIHVPALSGKFLNKDEEGENHNAAWHYWFIIGELDFLENSTRGASLRMPCTKQQGYVNFQRSYVRICLFPTYESLSTFT